ncbi:hypothetical protein OHA61_37185 [Streptomyces sp. NBC_00885]|uniref:hypothetical protein n=1 Tax=Streptomyces sp. NBC_00885 TaxID=2975857 RepID=UPI00386D19DD|nr:hypothetical protein OHA61_37185 [Streptomyces sp. NBC_00885]
MTRADARHEDGPHTDTDRTVLAAAGIEKAYRRGLWPARRRMPVLRGVDLTLARQRSTSVVNVILVGESWPGDLVPPYAWRLGAEAFSLVRAHEFDAKAVRGLCDVGPPFGLALTRRVLDVVAHGLQVTRIRLLDRNAPTAAE